MLKNLPLTERSRSEQFYNVDQKKAAHLVSLHFLRVDLSFPRAKGIK